MQAPVTVKGSPFVRYSVRIYRVALKGPHASRRKKSAAALDEHAHALCSLPHSGAHASFVQIRAAKRRLVCCPPRQDKHTMSTSVIK